MLRRQLFRLAPAALITASTSTRIRGDSRLRRLSKDISEQVHNGYNGYHISNVNEIRVTGYPASYILNLEVLDHIKVVRVVGDEMVELQEIEKQ